MNDLINVGELHGGVWDKRIRMSRQVWSADGVSPTLCAGMGAGGGTEIKIMELEEYYISQKGCNYILNPARGKMSRINPDEACTVTTHMGEWQGNFISDDIDSVQVNSKEYGGAEPTIIKMKNGDLIEYDGKEYRMMKECKEKFIGNIYGYGTGYDGSVYDTSGAGAAVISQGKNGGMILEAGHMVTETGKTHQTDVVYQKEGVAPTQKASGFKQPTMVAIGVTIGDSEEFGGDVKTPRVEISNTLRAGRNASGVIECKEAGTIEGGGFEKMHEMERRVYEPDGASPTVRTCGGGNQEPKIIQPKVLGNYTPSGHHNADVLDDSGCSPTVMENHGTVNAVYEPRAYDEQNQIIREDGTVGTLTTDGSSPKHNNRVIEPSFRIRKLTETECFRLMGVQDKDSRKIKQSKSSKYHLAGDSIVVQVLMAIFGEMTDIDWETKLYESREGVLGKNESKIAEGT